MARPQKIGLDYFSHDTDASSDTKVQAMESLYGNDGYAFVFKMFERIYREGGELKIQLSEVEKNSNDEAIVSAAETLAETRLLLSRNCAVTLERFELMLSTAIRRGVFCAESLQKRGVLTSPGIQKRCAPVIEKRKKLQELYENRKNSGETERVSAVETRQKRDKEKKSKVKSTVLTSNEVSISETPVFRGDVSEAETQQKPPETQQPLLQLGKVFRCTAEEITTLNLDFGEALLQQELPEMDLWLERAVTPNARKYRKPKHNHYLFARNWLKDKKLKPLQKLNGAAHAGPQSNFERARERALRTMREQQPMGGQNDD